LYQISAADSLGIEADMASNGQTWASTLNDKASELASLPASPVPSPAPAPPSEGRVDGGTKAWMAVFGGFLALVATFGQMNSFGSFQTYYKEHQLSHNSDSEISWIGTIQLWIFFFSVSSQPMSVLSNTSLCSSA
jgi:hypothetical protein